MSAINKRVEITDSRSDAVNDICDGRRMEEAPEQAYQPAHANLPRGHGP